MPEQTIKELEAEIEELEAKQNWQADEETQLALQYAG